jgi:hypothetical protein
VVGEIVGGRGLDSDNAFCVFEVRAGETWDCVGGEPSGQTQVDYPQARARWACSAQGVRITLGRLSAAAAQDQKQMHVWAHPVDLHFFAKSLQARARTHAATYRNMHGACDVQTLTRCTRRGGRTFSSKFGASTPRATARFVRPAAARGVHRSSARCSFVERLSALTSALPVRLHVRARRRLRLQLHPFTGGCCCPRMQAACRGHSHTCLRRRVTMISSAAFGAPSAQQARKCLVGCGGGAARRSLTPRSPAPRSAFYLGQAPELTSRGTVVDKAQVRRQGAPRRPACSPCLHALSRVDIRWEPPRLLRCFSS